MIVFSFVMNSSHVYVICLSCSVLFFLLDKALL